MRIVIMDSIHSLAGLSQTVKMVLYAGKRLCFSSRYQPARSHLLALEKRVEDSMKEQEIHSLIVKQDSSAPMLVVSPSQVQVTSV